MDSNIQTIGVSLVSIWAASIKWRLFEISLLASFAWNTPSEGNVTCSRPCEVAWGLTKSSVSNLQPERLGMHQDGAKNR